MYEFCGLGEYGEGIVEWRGLYEIVPSITGCDPFDGSMLMSIYGEDKRGHVP